MITTQKRYKRRRRRSHDNNLYDHSDYELDDETPNKQQNFTLLIEETTTTDVANDSSIHDLSLTTSSNHLPVPITTQSNTVTIYYQVPRPFPVFFNVGKHRVAWG